MNYIGSKLSLLPFLDKSIKEVVGEHFLGQTPSFCDAFAGTGIVGRHFKQQGCRVVANDLQYYSYVLNKHYIENTELPLFLGLEQELPQLKALPYDLSRSMIVCQYLDHIEGVRGFIYYNYSQGDVKEDTGQRLYFSSYNAQQCDAIRIRLEEWRQESRITEGEYYFLLATLLENIDKVANTASVYGAYLKRLKKSAQKPLQMLPAPIYLQGQGHSVHLGDTNAFIPQQEVDILYLDPPYNQRQYAANYHLLETIARYDAPSITGKTGMRDYSAQKSLYCSRREVGKVFEELIQNARARYIFLSYNNEGLLSLSEIERIMSQRGTYTRFEHRYNRYQADKASEQRRIKATETVEYLHALVID